MTQYNTPYTSIPSRTLDAADDLRKEWQLNGGPEDAPAVPEGVDTAALLPRHPSPNFTWTALERGALLAFGAHQREAGRREGIVQGCAEIEPSRKRLSEMVELYRQQIEGETWAWEGGGADNLESMSNSMAVVIRADQLRALATRQSVTAQLDAMRSAFHQNMLRAFPEKSHAEIDAEITRATGVAGPISALTDEQIIAALASVGVDAEKSQFANNPVLQVHTTVPGIREIFRALLAASPKVEPTEDLTGARIEKVDTVLWDGVTKQFVQVVKHHPNFKEQVSAAFAHKNSSRFYDAADIAEAIAELSILRMAPKVEPVSDDKRDAERYRWLRDKAMSYDQIGGFTPYVVKGQLMTTLEGATLDAAVDAAASQPKPTKESK